MTASDVRTGLALTTARGGTAPKPVLQNAVAIPFVATHIVDGRFQATELMEAGASATLDELAKLTRALLTLRALEPTTV